MNYKFAIFLHETKDFPLVVVQVVNVYTICGLNTVGLIIDAFGELRDQQEQVKEDMEVQRDTLF